jgi:hypothetical protein
MRRRLWIDRILLVLPTKKHSGRGVMGVILAIETHEHAGEFKEP